VYGGYDFCGLPHPYRTLIPSGIFIHKKHKGYEYRCQ